VPALRCENQECRDQVKRRKFQRGHGQQHRQAGVEMRSGERKNYQKNQRRKMDDSDGINHLRNHQLGHARAVVVIIGEQPEAGVEASAVFARLNQREVKIRQPVDVAQAC
jgi:hypothetical protein